jgi:hypothetical protein
MYPYLVDEISLLAIPDHMASTLSAGANINLSSYSEVGKRDREEAFSRPFACDIAMF